MSQQPLLSPVIHSSTAATTTTDSDNLTITSDGGIIFDNNAAADVNSSFPVASSLSSELFILFRIAFSTFLSVLSEWTPTLVAFICIGHYNENSIENLTIIGLSYTIYSIILHILWSLLTGLYTLIPLSVHNNNNRLTAIYIQRSFFITLIVSIPFVIILSYSGSILLILMDDINNICRILIFSLYIVLWLSILQTICEIHFNKFFNIFNIFLALLSLPLSWFLIFYLNLGIYGFPVILCIIKLIKLIITILLFQYYSYGYVFILKSFNILFNFDGITQYLSASLPGILSLFEMFISEMIIILSIYFGDGDIQETYVSVCITIILMIIIRFLQYIGTGISYSLSIRIYGYLCNSMINKSIFIIKLSYYLIFVINILISLILYFLSQNILNIFIKLNQSNEFIINDIINNYYLIYILIIYQFIMQYEYSLCGILRGINQSKIAPIIILLSHYLLPIPSLLILLFYKKYYLLLNISLILTFSQLILSKFISIISMQIYISCYVDYKKCEKQITAKQKQQQSEYYQLN